MKTYKSFVDFGAALEKLMATTIFNYKGNEIRQSIDGYEMGGKHYKTLEDIDIELQRQYDTWNTNIEKQNNG